LAQLIEVIKLEETRLLQPEFQTAAHFDQISLFIL
jgi:hypothetical protein